MHIDPHRNDTKTPGHFLVDGIITFPFPCFLAEPVVPADLVILDGVVSAIWKWARTIMTRADIENAKYRVKMERNKYSGVFINLGEGQFLVGVAWPVTIELAMKNIEGQDYAIISL